jgi:hypothetical protein
MYEAYDEAYDEAFDEAFDEGYDEAARGRRGSPMRSNPVKVASRGTSYRTPAPAGTANAPVTQSQLKAVTDRIAAALKTNGQAITVVDGRTRSLATEQGRLDAGLKKELSDRKKEISAVRRDLQSTREVGAIVPLIQTLAPGSPLTAFAPLLLLSNDVSGDATSANNSGGFLGLGGGGNGGMLGIVALLALSGALGGTTTKTGP